MLVCAPSRGRADHRVKEIWQILSINRLELQGF
jgi:hypothetical protein